MLLVEQHAVSHLQPHLRHERLSVGKGREVDVGGLVPRVGQLGRHRHPSGQRQPRAVPPVGEVGHGHDRAGGDPGHLPQHLPGPPGGLQGLAEHHHVVGVVGERVEVGVDVEREHGHPAPDAGEEGLAVDLDPGGATTASAQLLEQVTGATAEVENPAAARHEVGDDLEVAAH
jgi:hypothetical protein